MRNNLMDVSIWRGGDDGEYQTYQVPRLESQTVLDVVTYIQRELDPTLSYRFACRVGVCGSCAMTVNGKARWTCRTHVSKVAEGGQLTLDPLNSMPRVKDLVVDMETFFNKWADAKGSFKGDKTRDDALADISPDDPKRKISSAGIECIGCGACYATCDVIKWNPDYLGPAALNRAWTLVNDERDVTGLERLAAVAGDNGCLGCHSQQGCVERCPKSLNPTGAIAGLKRETIKAVLKGELS